MKSMEMPFWEPQAGMVGRTSMSRLSEDLGMNEKIEGAFAFSYRWKIRGFLFTNTVEGQRQTTNWGLLCYRGIIAWELNEKAGEGTKRYRGLRWWALTPVFEG